MDSEDIDLFDHPRQRLVPVRLWKPDAPPRGWILFSVGFGGERSGYAYLGRAWAALGLATAVIEHVGSNLEILKGLPGETRQERNQAVVRQVADPVELAARPRDVLWVYEQLAPRFAGLPLGVAGHSYGTYTVMAALGLPTVPRLPRLESDLSQAASSCLLISPQKPGMLFTDRVLGTLSVPTLVLTGTKDGPLNGEGDYRDRALVFDKLPEPTRNLVVLDEVEHMAFAAVGLGLGPLLRTVEGLTGQWWQSTLWQEQPPAVRAQEMEAAAAAGGVKGQYR